MTLHNVNNYKF